ncbi:MAG: dienelactone hydrolase family protein [Chloroflexota bacterium]
MKNRAAQILVVVLGTFLLVMLSGYAYVEYDVNAGTNSADLTNIEIDANGQTINAYLAEPEGEGPFPAVMMIHEWWGLRPEIITKADALADEGYVVLAVDAYRGRVTNSVPGALYMNLTYPEPDINADMDAFFDYLTGLETVNPAQVGIMGFCFGGRQSVVVGLRHADEIAGILTYYGGNQPGTEDALSPLAGTSTAVLGIFGAEDATISLETVDQFEASLQALKIPSEITVYDGVGHAFVQDITEAGPSRDAWLQGVAFLNANVRGDDLVE